MVNRTNFIARLVKTATPLVIAFGLAVLAVHAASWKRWVARRERGGDPRPSFGIKNGMAVIPSNTTMIHNLFGIVAETVFDWVRVGRRSALARVKMGLINFN